MWNLCLDQTLSRYLFTVSYSKLKYVLYFGAFASFVSFTSAHPLLLSVNSSLQPFLYPSERLVVNNVYSQVEALIFFQIEKP